MFAESNWSSSGWGFRPSEAPDEKETVTIDFESGVPVAVNGETTFGAWHRGNLEQDWRTQRNWPN